MIKNKAECCGGVCGGRSESVFKSLYIFRVAARTEILCRTGDARGDDFYADENISFSMLYKIEAARRGGANKICEGCAPHAYKHSSAHKKWCV